MRAVTEHLLYRQEEPFFPSNISMYCTTVSWYLQEVGDGIRIDCLVCVKLYNFREQFVFGRKVVEQQVRGGFERELPRWCCRRFCTGAITGREGGWRRTLGRLYSQHWGLLTRPNNENTVRMSTYNYQIYA